MANEFRHKDVGGVLTEAEYDALDAHELANQATGDIIYASSATQLSRLGIGTVNQILAVAGGIPAWLTTLPGAYIFSGGPSFAKATDPTATFTQNQDAASVQVAILQGDRATPTDNDLAYVSLSLSDSAGNQDEQARIAWQATTVLDGATQDSDLIFSILVNNVFTEMVRLDGSSGRVGVYGTAGFLQIIGAQARIQFGATLGGIDTEINRLTSGPTGLYTGASFVIGSETALDAAAVRVIRILNGTPETTVLANHFNMYSSDIVEGNAAPHFKTENGTIIKLYQQANIVNADGTLADITTKFNTLLTDLENLGVLAA